MLILTNKSQLSASQYVIKMRYFAKETKSKATDVATEC